MWTAFIITFRCLGRKRVGLLSGRVQVTSDEKGNFYSPSYLWKLRCSYLVLGCCMILCNIALVGPGLRSVQNASTSTRKLTRDVEDLMTQGLLIMDSVSRAQTNIEALDVESVLHVEDACPNLADNAFVSNAELQSSIAKLESEFNNLKDYIDGKNFENMRNSIDLVMKGTDVLDTAATTVESNDWAVKMFALILNVLVCFMMISTMVSLAGKNWPALRCIAVVIMFPVFAVLVAMGWVATGFFGIVSVSNAGKRVVILILSLEVDDVTYYPTFNTTDFCSGDAGEGGVEGTINNIFHERGVSADSIIFKSVLYYQSVRDDDICSYIMFHLPAC
jgi:hypothetical protein